MKAGVADVSKVKDEKEKVAENIKQEEETIVCACVILGAVQFCHIAFAIAAFGSNHSVRSSFIVVTRLTSFLQSCESNEKARDHYNINEMQCST